MMGLVGVGRFCRGRGKAEILPSLRHVGYGCVNRTAPPSPTQNGEGGWR